MSHDEETHTNTEKNSAHKMSTKPKKILTDYFQPKNVETTTMVSKTVQVDIDQIPSELNSEAKEKYWSMLAEEKRIELEDALIENARLYKIKDSLIKQNNYYKEMLEEANSFITVFKEVVQDPADDTGIGLTELDDSSEN